MTTKLTRPEMLLARFNEFRSLEEKRLADEKRSEKQFLSHMSLSMSVPTTTTTKVAKEEPTKPEIENNETEEPKKSDPIVPIPRNKVDDNQVQTSAEKQPAKKVKNAVTAPSSSSSSNIAEIPPPTDAADDENAVKAVSTTAAVSKIKKRKAVADDDMEGIMSMDGGDMPIVLFGPLGTLSNKDWDPSTEPIMKDIMLNNFSLDTYQTLGLRLTIPPQSKRWSINISPSDHCDCTNILLHFNPRYNTKKGKTLEINDKQGTFNTNLCSIGTNDYISSFHVISADLQ